MSLRVFKDYREYFEEVKILVAGCSLGVEGGCCWPALTGG